MKELKVKNRKNRVEEKSLTITRNVVRIFLIIWSILIVFPILWAVLSSLKTNLEFGTNAWKLPEKLQWVNYKEAWEGANFSKYFLNSLILSAGTVALSIIMTTTSAYVIGKFVHPVVKSIEIFYSIFMMVPQMLLLIPLLQMCKKMNMTKSNVVLFTLMITNALQGVPFYVFLLTPFMRSINNSILEAASIDGANQFQVMFKVMMPMCKNIFIALFMLEFIAHWNDYTPNVVFLRSYPMLAYALYHFRLKTPQPSIPLQLSSSTLVIIPTLAIFIAFKDKIMSNLTIGGLKG